MMCARTLQSISKQSIAWGIRVDGYCGDDMDIGVMPYDYPFDSNWLRHHEFHLQQSAFIPPEGIKRLPKGSLVIVMELQCKPDGGAVLRFGIRGTCNLLEFPVHDRMFPLIPACAIRSVGGSLTLVRARIGELDGLPVNTTFDRGKIYSWLIV
jgi:hypothetical protein